ncbi:MAG: HAMP domain-containing sensor histidine kinase [Gemmataceae bacterium]
MLNILRIRAARKRVELVTDLGALPDFKGHPARIHQVVMNLVHNAIDACAEGGRVELRTRAAGPNVEIHVLDNGAGIPADHLGKIFDPFFTTKPPGMGTGLGLSICHAIVEEHGGRINVESKVGQGTHFTVTLPVRAIA